MLDNQMKVMKRSAMIVFVLTLFFSIFFLSLFFLSTIPGVQAGINASNSLSGIQLLPSDNIWNVPISTMPVDARSSTYVSSIGTQPLLFYDGYYLNVLDNTSGITPQYLTSIQWPYSSDNVPYPIPNPAKIQTPDNTDQILQIYNRENNMFYWLYHAKKAADGTWSASQANAHNMSSNDIRPGKDLPEIQGELRYEEVAAGSVKHAIQGTIEHTNESYVWPYFMTNGEGYTDGKYPPNGQRFRLKSSVDISGYSPMAKTIAQAMKTYGLIVTDQHGSYKGIQIIAINDDRWCSIYNPSCDLHALMSLNSNDFEAVDTSALMINISSMEAKWQPPQEEYTYSFIHISDIQNIAQWYPTGLSESFSRIESLKSQYNISAIFITGDLTNEYGGLGLGTGADFVHYANAVSKTTIPVYEVTGNHDVYAIDTYTAWDMYVPSGSSKHNYGFTFNDFVVYGFGWNGEKSLNSTARKEMINFFAAYPTKTPIVLEHAYMFTDGTRLPIARDLEGALTRNSIILCGHEFSPEIWNLTRTTTYNSSYFLEDLVNAQDHPGIVVVGKIYHVTTDGTTITKLEISDLYIEPDLVVNSTTRYNPDLSANILEVISRGSSDGEVDRSVISESFTSIRDGRGNAEYSKGGWSSVGIQSANDNNANRYDTMKRFMIYFNTSDIPDNAIVESATLGIWSSPSLYQKSQLGSTSIGITGVNPIKAGVINLGDYKQIKSTRYSTDIPCANIADYGWNTWKFNDAGIANISKNGWTNISVRTAWDIDNSTTGLTWLPYQNATTFEFLASEASVGKEPFLTITYSR